MHHKKIIENYKHNSEVIQIRHTHPPTQKERNLLMLNKVKTKLHAGQKRLRQHKPEKPWSWELANSVQSIWPVTSKGNTALLGYRITHHMANTFSLELQYWGEQSGVLSEWHIMFRTHLLFLRSPRIFQIN